MSHHAVLDRFGCRSRGLGTSEVEALCAVTAEPVHDRLLGAALDPLRDEPEPERLPETDDAAQKRKVVVAGVDPGGEAPVDLDDVDGQSLQVRERCVAGTEI